MQSIVGYFDDSTGCLKKRHLKEMSDFLTLKILPLALAWNGPKQKSAIFGQKPTVIHGFVITNCQALL